MKKSVAIILVLSLVLSIASVASAKTTDFNIVTSSTNIYQVGTAKFDRNLNQWYVDINMSTSNIAADHRAVTRVHQGASVASATWVYSAYSDVPRGYISGYKTGLTYRGRLDDRDSGLLEFHGVFHY
ncbi:MAG: hypothetical protein RSE38_14515 [Acinetobacter sp.]